MVWAEVSNAHESITAEAKARNDVEIDLKKEQKIEYYKEKTNIDIENINIIDMRHKVYTNLWRAIYEVIKQYFVYETDIFTNNFIKN